MRYLVFILVFLNACDQKPAPNDLMKVPKQVIPIKSPFIGKWKSIPRPQPYSADLIIEENGRFYFEQGACVYVGFSNGTWKEFEEHIILNSFVPDSCLSTFPFNITCWSIEGDYPGGVTIAGCKPDYAGEEYVMLENDTFTIINDSLQHMNRDLECPVSHIFTKSTTPH